MLLILVLNIICQRGPEIFKVLTAVRCQLSVYLTVFNERYLRPFLFASEAIPLDGPMVVRQVSR